MGDKKQNTQSTQTQNSLVESQPWQNTVPTLDNIIGRAASYLPGTRLTGNEKMGLEGLIGNAKAGNPFAGGISGLATDLLGQGPISGMAQQGYSDFKNSMTPYTTASTNPWDNADFGRTINDVTSRTMDAVKSSYQGAGIPAAAYGDFAKTAGEGITSAVAPLAWNASNDLNNRKLGAINSLYGGANTSAGLLSGMGLAGVGTAQAANQAQNQPHMQLLAAEAMRRGIPMEALRGISNLIVPMAQLGGTRTGSGTSVGNSQTTQTPGLMDYLSLFSGGGNSSVSGMANAGSALIGKLAVKPEAAGLLGAL